MEKRPLVQSLDGEFVSPLSWGKKEDPGGVVLLGEQDNPCMFLLEKSHYSRNNWGVERAYTVVLPSEMM